MVKEQDPKMTSLARVMDCSVGEVSKILSGERQNYYKYIHLWADFFKIPFLELVKNDAQIIQTNHQQDGVIAVEYKTVNDLSQIKEFVKDLNISKEISKSKDEHIKTLTDMISIEKENKEYWKEKYYRSKEKLQNKEKESE